MSKTLQSLTVMGQGTKKRVEAVIDPTVEESSISWELAESLGIIPAEEAPEIDEDIDGEHNNPVSQPKATIGIRVKKKEVPLAANIVRQNKDLVIGHNFLSQNATQVEDGSGRFRLPT